MSLATEPEHRFAGAYDPEKFASILTLEPQMLECECGVPLIRTIYTYGGKNHCLSCVLDAAGIERTVLRR
ncbi:hypothetical protein [Paenibacillus albus]|uniref:Uncharacterized protein n=1 Tax=Paenibacillus albus TaxID=2495582 RepID=A0A3Q8X947_9BACL|nr:hypothetical protein [Paenibacillus albus]AZN43383.1 hypothetical protein EJC50_29590 [Paenibacillus albus]